MPNFCSNPKGLTWKFDTCKKSPRTFAQGCTCKTYLEKTILLQCKKGKWNDYWCASFSAHRFIVHGIEVIKAHVYQWIPYLTPGSDSRNDPITAYNAIGSVIPCQLAISWSDPILWTILLRSFLDVAFVCLIPSTTSFGYQTNGP